MRGFGGNPRARRADAVQSHQLSHGNGDRPGKARHRRDARLVPPRRRGNASRWWTARSMRTRSMCMRARRRSTAMRRCRRAVRPSFASTRTTSHRRRARLSGERAGTVQRRQAIRYAEGPYGQSRRGIGYDDAQAQLAGIQRLLTIAGYDAYPIDGIRGANSQAALAQFIKDRHLPANAAASRISSTRCLRPRATRRASALPGATTPNTQ